MRVVFKWDLGNPEYGCELEPIDFAAFALEPPMPANVSVKQAAKFAESLAKGEAEPDEDCADGAVGQGAGDDLRSRVFSLLF